MESSTKSIFDLLGGEYFLPTFDRAEANFATLFSTYADHIRETGRTHLLFTQGEHPSIAEGIKRLEKFEVQGKEIPLNDRGQLTAPALKEHLKPRSAMLSLSWVHDLTGVIQPVMELAEICRLHDVRLHLDATEAIGKLFIDFAEICDIMTLPIGAVSKVKISPLVFGRSPIEHRLSALANMIDQMEHFAFHVGPLRDSFESQILEAGGQIFYKESDRAPHISCFGFPGIHADFFGMAEPRLAALTGREEAMSIKFDADVTKEEIDQKVKELLSLKDRAKLHNEGIIAPRSGMRHIEGKSEDFTLSCLIDEEDGVVSDARFEAFGPRALFQTLNITCDLLIRKNYEQARRLTADLIEKKEPASSPYVNAILEVIDEIAERCLDIPVAATYEAPPEMDLGETKEYPGWLSLSDEEKQAILTEVIQTEVEPYVALDGGGVSVQKVASNHVSIEYSGNCTSCFSATGATLDAIQNILRQKIHPEITVIPLMGELEI